MGCLTTAKMNMRATVLKAAGSPEVSDTGRWQIIQNPDSGAIEKFWIIDDPSTSTYEGDAALASVPVLARGVLNAGLRSAGDTESFDTIYENVSWVKMQFPAGFNITQRDRVTNIRDRDGNAIWKETDIDGSPPTQFNVMGITPVINQFGKATEYVALLKRAEVQE